MTLIAQLLKLTHREQNILSSLQKSTHIFCFTHILKFKMALFACTKHDSLHKTHKSVVCNMFAVSKQCHTWHTCSDVHMLHWLVWWKIKKINLQQHVCVSANSSVQSEEFSAIWTILVLWQSILKTRVLFILPNSV